MAGRDPSRSRVRCERAAHWASLRLDGELSHLEDRLLEDHLGRCEECRNLEAGMRSTAQLLRRAPVEEPSRRAVVSLPRPSQSPFRRKRTALVAAAALGLGALVGSFAQGPSARAPQAPGPEVSLLTRDVQQLRDLPRLEDSPTVPPPNLREGII
jgi:ferric-dicitrate binding protein FerR (iron transport regulator)